MAGYIDVMVKFDHNMVADIKRCVKEVASFKFKENLFHLHVRHVRLSQ